HGRLPEGGVVDGAEGEAAAGQVLGRPPVGAGPAAQAEVDDVAAGGEVEADEHVAGGPHRGDAVAADRRGLVELEVDVGRPQRVRPLPRQVHEDVAVRAHLAADVEVRQVALVVGNGAGDHRRHR